MRREDRPKQAFTRRGNRIYRHAYHRDGVETFAEGYTFRMKKDGVQHYFSLGTELEAAKSMADRIGAFLSVPSNTVEQLYDHSDFAHLRPSRRVTRAKHAKPPTVETKKPTVGEFCLRYEAVTGHLSRFSVSDNLNSLRRIVAHSLGLPRLSRHANKAEKTAWHAKVRAVQLDLVTPVVVESFRQEMLKSAGQDHLKRAKAATTSNSYIRCAASMFAPKLSVHFQDFELPAINPFRTTRPLPEPSHRYVSSIDASDLLKLARTELETSQPEVYLVIVLALCCGMRRAEIDRLTWEQVDLAGGHIWIRTTAYSRPKARNSESRIDLAPEVVHILKTHRHSWEAGPFVIPGSLDLKVRVRCMPTFAKALQWLRSHGVKSVTALHTLRKEAGSLIFSQVGSIDVAADFLRNDVKVAREHYIGRKQRLQLQFPELAVTAPALDVHASART
ncbi:phage integrase family protein [Roseimicrobium gellanilyticum]|uniref:Phage integrase family protein n=1 Tax=Roseimicrobium gellanilyticum TaxID=748857 RepID=A0A366H979_9BACT|nr:tyrosine-type recombinase/integrase [Roseimicrobium gellanilyticum]RBP38158.1 phage integrase family protein [Roseimicrobium gellanilyticum]